MLPGFPASFLRRSAAVLGLASLLGCGVLRVRTFEPQGAPALEASARRTRMKDGYRVELRLPKRDDWRAEFPLDPGTTPEIRQEAAATLVTWPAEASRFSGRPALRKAFALRLQSQGKSHALALSTNTFAAKTGLWTLGIASSPIWVPFAVPLLLLPSGQAEPRLPGFTASGPLEWRFEALPDGSHRIMMIPLEGCTVTLLSENLPPERLSLGSACGFTWTLPPGRWETRPCLVFHSSGLYYVLHATDSKTSPIMTLRGDP